MPLPRDLSDSRTLNLCLRQHIRESPSANNKSPGRNRETDKDGDGVGSARENADDRGNTAIIEKF